jgi:prepilin-type N-terminal cleavage/methylation domain-containing protein
MKARPAGFTLLEVMVAIVLTSLVALMAYASARVSVESAAVIRSGLVSVQSDRAARQVLLDLLHNVRPSRGRGDTSFALSGDTLTFTAAGAPPLDPEYDWLVAVRPDEEGLALVARSVGRGPASRRTVRLPRITRWQVRALPPHGREWTETWAPGALLPGGVGITFWSGERQLGSPLTIRMSEASATPAESDLFAE